MQTKIINLLLVLAIIGISAFLVFLLKNVWQSKVDDKGNASVILVDVDKHALQQSISSNQESIKEFDNSLSMALKFLIEEQSPTGGFFMCMDDNRQDCKNKQQPPIITAQILIALEGILSKEEEISSLKQKAIQFLLNSQEKDGLWRFYDYLPPDLDDTSVSSLALKLSDQDFIFNADIVASSRNNEGIFETWVIKQDAESQDNKFKQDIDCVVNANILAYFYKINFGKDEIIKPVCDYLRSHIVNRQSCSPYYPSRLMFFYSISRALNDNTSCILENKEVIIQEIINNFNEGVGGFGDEMETAFAINTLLKFGYDGKEIDRAIQYLLQKQNQDGSFNSGIIFTNSGQTTYFSSAFSTAVVAEALARYQKVTR